MLRKVIIQIFFVFPFISFSECRSVKHFSPDQFKIKKAYYQPWVVSENEKGTDIMLELTKADNGVVFDSIVFRGVRLKAFTTIKNKGVELKSILPAGISRIKIESQVVGLPDQLIYHDHGERKSCPLTKIERKRTKYY
jgi:hypothetical protein